jgi:hypothetical protein
MVAAAQAGKLIWEVGTDRIFSKRGRILRPTRKAGKCCGWSFFEWRIQGGKAGVLRMTPPDAITQAVLTLMVPRPTLRDCIEYRLRRSGQFQDAMWTKDPWLFHSRISAAMNLKLLNSR